MNVFSAIYRPVLTYGGELWVLSERRKSKIQAAETSAFDKYRKRRYKEGRRKEDHHRHGTQQ